MEMELLDLEKNYTSYDSSLLQKAWHKLHNIIKTLGVVRGGERGEREPPTHQFSRTSGQSGRKTGRGSPRPSAISVDAVTRPAQPDRSRIAETSPWWKGAVSVSSLREASRIPRTRSPEGEGGGVSITPFHAMPPPPQRARLRSRYPSAPTGLPWQQQQHRLHLGGGLMSVSGPWLWACGAMPGVLRPRLPAGPRLGLADHAPGRAQRNPATRGGVGSGLDGTVVSPGRIVPAAAVRPRPALLGAAPPGLATPGQADAQRGVACARAASNNCNSPASHQDQGGDGDDAARRHDAREHHRSARPKVSDTRPSPRGWLAKGTPDGATKFGGGGWGDGLC